MSCNCNSSTYTSTCCPEVPYPQISSESVPSLIDNLVYALYGTINKSIVNGRVIWDIPCDPANTPATIDGIPRNEGEGLLCYIIRALNLSIPSGFVTVDAVQTLTNKTLVSPTITGTGAIAGVFTGNLTGNSATATTATTALSCSGASALNVLKSGDTMTGGLIVSTNTATDAVRITQVGTGAAFRVEDSVNPDSTPFIITNTGNVGIGKLNPTYSLDVNGSIKSTSYNGEQTTIVDSIVNYPISLNQGLVSSINSFTNFVSFDGSITDKTITGISTDPIINTIIYMTCPSHGLQDYDFITFSGQTGNNIVFNGTFTVRLDSIDPINKFFITLSSAPAGSLTTPTPGRIIREYGRGGFGGDFVTKIGRNSGNGDYIIYFSTTMLDTNYLVFGNASNQSLSLTSTFTPSATNTGIIQPVFSSTTALRVITTSITTTPVATNFSKINIGIIPNF